MPLIRVHFVLCAVESSGKDNNKVMATMLMQGVTIAKNSVSEKKKIYQGLKQVSFENTILFRFV